MPASDEHSEPTGATAPRRARRWLVIWVAVSIAGMIAAFAAGRAVHSPWEDAVTNAAARPIVSVEVEERDFTPAPVTVQGTVVLGETLTIRATADSVVTQALVRRGDIVESGTAVTELSGRPVIVLGLPFPLYRDLAPGDEGPDVEALQSSLAALRIYGGPVDGSYGLGTAQAVQRLYVTARARPPSVPADRRTAAERAVAALAETKAKPGSATYARLVAAKDKAVLAAATPLASAEVFPVPKGAKAAVVSIRPRGTTVAAEGAVVVLRSGSPVARTRVGAGVKDSLEVGTQVRVSTPDGEVTVNGDVTSVSAFRSDDPAGYDLTITLDKTPDVDDGSEVLVSTLPETERAFATAVPVTALREDSVGTFVWRQRPESGTAADRVAVTVGEQRDGFAALLTGGLRPGDLVVVAGR